MIDAPRWFDRTFAFPYPANLFHSLRSRLRGAPARLSETLRGQPRARRTRHAPGTWSAQEHAGHLVDLDSLWLARVGDFLNCDTRLTPADLTNRATTEARHNARPLRTIINEFRAARARLLASVDSAAAGSFSHRLLHPRMQTPMALTDHLYFVAEHDDHHLARIWTLLNEEGL
jgi:uncharacterized damage-inducible protein DinB